MEYKVKGAKAQAFKRVPDKDGVGTFLVTNGFVVGDLIVTIDFDAIVRAMGRKALKSVSKTCRDGYVVVKAKNVRREAA